MSFWSGITGSPSDCFTTDMQPLPNNTHVIAECQGAAIEQGDNPHIQLKWKVLDGEFKGRLLWQKLYIFAQDQKKADKAKNMLMLLFILNNLKVPTEMPTQTDLYGFNGKITSLLVGQYAIPKEDGTIMKGNFIREAHPSDYKPVIESAFDRNPRPTGSLASDDIPF
mgnify:CR=1 FL=1